MTYCCGPLLIFSLVTWLSVTPVGTSAQKLFGLVGIKGPFRAVLKALVQQALAKPSLLEPTVQAILLLHGEEGEREGKGKIVDWREEVGWEEGGEGSSCYCCCSCRLLIRGSVQLSSAPDGGGGQ